MLGISKYLVRLRYCGRWRTICNQKQNAKFYWVLLTYFIDVRGGNTLSRQHKP